MDTVWSAQSLRSLMRKSWEINMLYPGVSLVTSRSLRSLLRNHLRSSGHPCINGQDHQLARKEVTSPFGVDSRTSNETATSPMHTSQEVHSPGTPAEGWGVVVPRRRLDHLRVHDNEGVLVGACLPVFYPAMAKPARRVQIAKNPVVRYPVEVSSASFDKDTHSFSNQEQETQHLQKAVDSLLEKGSIEPVHRSHFLGFFSRLFLHPVIEIPPPPPPL